MPFSVFDVRTEVTSGGRGDHYIPRGEVTKWLQIAADHQQPIHFEA